MKLREIITQLCLFRNKLPEDEWEQKERLNFAIQKLISIDYDYYISIKRSKDANPNPRG